MTTKMISEETLQPQAQEETRITPRDLRRVFWRSFQMEFSWNYERQMNLAFVYALIPVLKKLYPRREELAAALKRHLVFFNTTPHIVTLLLGITTAMEEKNSQQKNMDATAIDNVKASLMGPLAGLGDSFLLGDAAPHRHRDRHQRPALKGNILGPILFLLVFNVPHILVRWCFTRWGYVLGTGVLQRIQKSGMMASLTYGASIIGLMVVGAMTASMIDITIPLSFGAGEAKTQVQDIINDILPCMLPLVSFGIVYWLLGRKVKPLSIIGGMALVGILGSWIGLF
ncbi:PTS system mannose/fructose/sorbose family transporter subunit IID [Klebsiella pneumoniae]|uniref:PTS system mannose/fructose/sorbose family transporter subunit IID n=11 Tax=Enterobacteriaceae TaxID=543 RepID=A0A927DBM9_KLEPN|nr:PTS system mannose/fructose/sorbose family transporter subunit IID [Klebsiella pneumoniae]